MRLSDTIEAFIKSLLQEDQETCELKRNELAECEVGGSGLLVVDSLFHDDLFLSEIGRYWFVGIKNAGCIRRDRTYRTCTAPQDRTVVSGTSAV